jgi:hypothetical protein
MRPTKLASRASADGAVTLHALALPLPPLELPQQRCTYLYHAAVRVPPPPPEPRPNFTA